MSVVTLVSGGLDSSLMALLAKEQGVEQFPLFIDYGQRSRDREFASCARNLQTLGLPSPAVANLDGFGGLIRSGLTDQTLHVKRDAFTPGRNLLFLLVGASYASQVSASGVAIGLLDERFSIFPDQTSDFLATAERMLRTATATQVSIVAPLMGMSKRDVVKLAKAKGLGPTYSCHAGTEIPCGACIACQEFIGTEEA